MLKQAKCLSCKHFIFDDTIVPKCEAFPEIVERKEEFFPCAIPHVIFAEQFDHTKPYPGDNGIQYEPIDE